jgi:hypothetical protein
MAVSGFGGLILILLLLVGAGVIVPQVFLSRKESKWPGLILPIISFGISLVAVGGLTFFPTAGATLTENGEVIEQVTTQTAEISSVAMTVITTFLLCNISTAVLLIIYAACRGTRKRRRELEKMSVQDLE